jgi:hypothetical protein
MNPCYQKAATLEVSSIDKKLAALDYNQVRKIVKYLHRYEEEMRYEHVWNMENGTNQPVGEPQGIAMRSKEYVLYAVSLEK